MHLAEISRIRDGYSFGQISDYLASGSPITEGLIRDIHKGTVQGVRGGQGQPGRYRTVQDAVNPRQHTLPKHAAGAVPGFDFRRQWR